MSKIETNTIAPSTGTTLTLGESGDTVNVGGTAGTGFGKILQVVSATDSTQRTTTSTSYVTGSNTLSASITPSSTSNTCNYEGRVFLRKLQMFYESSYSYYSKSKLECIKGNGSIAVTQEDQELF